MKKLLLSILTITSLTAFSQWQASTTILSSGEECFYAFSKVIASDASSNTINTSTDDGNNWTLANTGVPSTTVGLKPSVLNGGTLYGYMKNTIYQTTNASSWSSMTTSMGASETIKGMAVLNGTVFAVTNSSAIKIYQLNGTTWSLKSTIPVATASLANCMANINGQLWVGTTHTLAIKSTDAGSSWAAITPTLNPANWWDKDVFSLGATTSTIFMGTYGSKLMKSTDGGASWSTAYNTLGGISGVNDIYVMSNNNILVATDSGFVYSTNGGGSFQKDNLGMNFSQYEFKLNRITVSTNSIIASTGNGTIMRRGLNQIFSGINENELRNIESKVYPNPATDFVTIEAGDLMFNDKCSIKLTDVLGREIDVVEMKDGKANLSLNNFSKGLYTYSVYNNKTIVSKGKLVVN